MNEETKLFMKMRNITLIVGQFDSSEENSIPNSHKRIFRRKRRPADHIKKEQVFLVVSDRRTTDFKEK